MFLSTPEAFVAYVPIHLHCPDPPRLTVVQTIHFLETTSKNTLINAERARNDDDDENCSQAPNVAPNAAHGLGRFSTNSALILRYDRGFSW